MLKIRQVGAVLATLAVTVMSTACDQEDTRTITGVRADTTTVTIVRTDTVRVGNRALVFNQIERLGRPLVSEVLLDKRLHSFYNTVSPSQDSTFFRDEIIQFVNVTAGRPLALGRQIASILLPDMLVFFPNRPSGNVAPAALAGEARVGYLTWALFPGEGFGGRKLDNDDVVDKSLMAIFGPLLSNVDVKPGLSTDNVGEFQTDLNVFPYVAPPITGGGATQ